MPRYYIERRDTGEAWEVEAPYAADGCERLGWLIGMCYVRVIREGPLTKDDPPFQVRLPDKEPE